VVTSSSRATTLAGAPNFRDLGGVPCADGRRVLPGKVLRSEALHALTEEDLQAMAEMGIALVCDLRRPEERELWPSRWQEAPRTMVPVRTPDEVESEGASVLALFETGTGESTRAAMLEIYRRLPHVATATLRTLLGEILDGNLPVLVHCSAGKDRTGFVCAVLLSALGADRDVVMEEYLVSDEYFGYDRIAELGAILATDGMNEGMIDALRCRPDYLEQAWASIDDGWGGVDEYLEQALGLDEAARRRLSELLLEG
jgi:protein-tyrosine phosphatase